MSSPLHERKAPPHKLKAPLLTIFWRRFWIGATFWTPAPATVPKRDSSSCPGSHGKFTLRLLCGLRKLESNVYFASWNNIDWRSYFAVAHCHLNKRCHGFSAGNQWVASYLFCITVGNLLTRSLFVCHVVAQWRIQGGDRLGQLPPPKRLWRPIKIAPIWYNAPLFAA